MRRRDRVLILGTHWKGKPSSLPERKRHLEELRNGAKGYGVVCEAKEPRPIRPRSIAGFNHEFVLKFGELIEDDNGVYARIIDRVPVIEIAAIRTSYKSIVPGLKSILAGRADTTTKEALAHARVGQGRFRNESDETLGFSMLCDRVENPRCDPCVTHQAMEEFY